MLDPDRHLEHWLAGHRVARLDWFFLVLSRIGTLGVVWIALALAFAFLWRRPRIFITTAAAVYASDLLTALIKAFVHRHRPFEHQIGPSQRTHSFPSGHSATAFAGATMLSLFVPRLRVVFYVLAVLIAFSRLYNGVHYPTDVLAGGVLGVLVALAAQRVFRLRRR